MGLAQHSYRHQRGEESAQKAIEGGIFNKKAEIMSGGGMERCRNDAAEGSSTGEKTWNNFSGVISRNKKVQIA